MTLSRAPPSVPRASETQAGRSKRQLLRQPPALRADTRPRPRADSGANSKRRSGLSAREVRRCTIAVPPPSGETLLGTAAQRDGERALLPTVFASPSGSLALAGHDPGCLRKRAQQLNPDVELETMQASLEDLAQIVAYVHGQLLWVD